MKQSVLLISSNLNLKYALEELLDPQFALLEASSEKEAVEILTRHPVQLILLDQIAPQAELLKFVGRIRSHQRISLVPLIQLIDSHDGILAKEALFAGVSNFLPVPFSQSTLRTCLLVALHHTKKLQELYTFSKKLKSIAEHDQLTHLYNRTVLYDQGKKEVDKAMRGSLPLSLLMIDIDKFKQLNDTYGHLAGDAVLTQFAHLISKSQRSYDLTVRFGGEEFVILLPNTTPQQALIVAEKIRTNTASSPFTWENGVLPSLSISIGIAGLNEKITRLEDLLQAADQALYFAKTHGRNQVHVA